MARKRVPGEDVAHHHPVALLEDVQRQERVRKQHRVRQREERQPAQRRGQRPLAVGRAQKRERGYQPKTSTQEPVSAGGA